MGLVVSTTRRIGSGIGSGPDEAAVRGRGA